MAEDRIRTAIDDQARFKWLLLQEPPIDVVTEALKKPDVEVCRGGEVNELF